MPGTNSTVTIMATNKSDEDFYFDVNAGVGTIEALHTVASIGTIVSVDKVETLVFLIHTTIGYDRSKPATLSDHCPSPTASILPPCTTSALGTRNEVQLRVVSLLPLL